MGWLNKDDVMEIINSMKPVKLKTDTHTESEGKYMTNEEASIIIGNIPINGDDECYSIAKYQQAKAMAIEALERKEKIGEWIYDGYTNESDWIMGRKRYHCSSCDLHTYIRTTYCPNCGSKNEETSL